MSTVVTYKGETLTTVTNGTKVLLTSGKYMEDDITLVDDSTPVIPISIARTSVNVTSFNLSWSTMAEENI